MQAAEKELDTLAADGYDATNIKDFYTAGQGPLRNGFASGKGQVNRQQQEDWVRAKLRKESGAAIPPEEMDREIKVYFPQPLDGPEVIASKKRSRGTAEQQMILAAGRAYQPNKPSAADADAEIGPLAGGLSAEEQAELDELRKRIGKK